jgi:hypothetical protein
MVKGLTDEQKIKHQYLMANFPYYSKNILKVAPAAGGAPVPFELNLTQRYIHARLEEQKKECGYVRAVILKARRHGASTVVGGRFYHRTSTNPGMRAFILSHHSRTTQVLFNMTKRFHKEAPLPIQPDISKANVYNLSFDTLGSEYSVGTAGSAEIGRGDSIQLFHGSEVAYWENTDRITAGVMQAIELLKGTEIILESTANGKGNKFYRMCMDAVNGIGDYILIFAPWYWHKAYSRPVPLNFTPTQEEIELLNTPIMIPSETGLPLIPSKMTLEQIYWRRMKIVEFRNEANPLGKFKQEYPGTISEAFQSSGNSLIVPSKIVSARKANIQDPNAPLLMGCDLARSGTQIVFSYRRGREFVDYEKIPHVYISENPTNILTSIIAQRIETRNVDKCFIDYGHGHGVFDNLKSLGYAKNVVLVHFNESPLDKDLYLNKRSEMIILVQQWFHEGGVSVPDKEELEINLLSVPDYENNARGLKFIIAKKVIEQETGVDLGIFDSFALTFAYPVSRNLGNLRDIKRIKLNRQVMKSRLKTRQRVQNHSQQGRHEITFNWGGA